MLLRSFTKRILARRIRNVSFICIGFEAMFLAVFQSVVMELLGFVLFTNSIGPAKYQRDGKKNCNLQTVKTNNQENQNMDRACTIKCTPRGFLWKQPVIKVNRFLFLTCLLNRSVDRGREKRYQRDTRVIFGSSLKTIMSSYFFALICLYIQDTFSYWVKI